LRQGIVVEELFPGVGGKSFEIETLHPEEF
jgi:hypothetical protein